MNYMLLIIMYLGFAAGPLRAETHHSNEIGKDIREDCRATISGNYLNVIGDFYSLKGSIGHLEEKEKKLQRLAKELDKEKAKLDSAGTSKKFDIKRLEQLTVINAKLQAAREESWLVEKELIRQKMEFNRAESIQKEIEKKMQPVFSITRQTPREKTGGKYIIDIAYLHECPRFKFLCPLPENQRLALTDLADQLVKHFPDAPQLVACQRYANILPRRN